MAKKTKANPYRSPAHQALAEREVALAAQHAHQGLDAQFTAIAADRAARWAALLTGREESAEIRTWAQQMAQQWGNSRVRIWRNTVDWITALYIGRYGEAEDFWPPQLTADDARRAQRWLQGGALEGVVYLPREG